MDIKKYFGKTIQRLRKERTSFSQEKFGEEINCHRTYISQIERGIRNPSLQYIFNIAKALNMSMSELLKEVETELNDQ